VLNQLHVVVVVGFATVVDIHVKPKEATPPPRQRRKRTFNDEQPPIAPITVYNKQQRKYTTQRMSSNVWLLATGTHWLPWVDSM
jgi:hypothetical protein